MFNVQTIKRMKKEWTTWNKNIPSRINTNNIGEFHKYLLGYYKRLDMGISQFNEEMMGLVSYHDSQYAGDFRPHLSEDYKYWSEVVRSEWWGFMNSILEINYILSEYKPEQAESVEEAIKRLNETSPDIDWVSYFNKNPPRTQKENNELAMEEVFKKLKKRKARAERKWRSFAKKLKEFASWLNQRDLEDQVSIKTTFDVEDDMIKGVPFRFFGAPSKYGVEFRETLYLSAIPYYLKRVQKVAPIIKEMQIPFHVHFQKTHGCGSAAACYKNNFIDIAPDVVLFQSSKPKEIVQILVHEMGHHIWRNYLREGAKEFWSDAINGDFGDVDMEDAIKAWERAEKREGKIREIDPILYLQMEGLYHSPRYKNKGILGLEDAIEAYQEGRLPRMVRVPKNPITGYAQKNPEEAFCEALSMLVAYGSRVVIDRIRYLLQVILPNQVKLASKKRIKSNFEFTQIERSESMNHFRYKLASLIKRVAELEESAESAFFDDPTKKNVRQFAESQAITNKLDTVKKVIETQEVGSDDALIKSQTAIAPPPPEETVKKPGGKELSTLNQFIVKTDEGVKGVPTSHSEINRAKPPVMNPTKKEIKQDLINKVVDRHLTQKDKVKVVKRVLKEKMR